MFESLLTTHERLIDEVQVQHQRFLYQDFNLDNRLTGLVGPRGVGKTTLLLQYIKLNLKDDNKVFYFSADHIYFKSTLLYSFVEQLILNHGITTFFIDEIHKYENWSQELKNLYDSFPKLKIVFSGSSSLDLIKGSYDLSRRAKMYYLPGMSFREYLNLNHQFNFAAIEFDELIQHHQDVGKEILQTDAILGLYHEYLNQGFYPFLNENPHAYYEKLLAIIDKTIYEDIANFYNLKTSNLGYLSKILNYLASIPPGKISTYNLGKNLNIDNKTAAYYLKILSETGLVTMIYADALGGTGIRKPEKVFFNNTNLHYAFAERMIGDVVIGTVRELAFIQATTNAGLQVNYSMTGDYSINDYVFEIGGKNKTAKQIKAIDKSFVVKDDVIVATSKSIPLLLFGFLY